MPLMYRSMEIDADGMPKTGRSAKHLGVRILGDYRDIDVDEAGYVLLNAKGMSVAPEAKYLYPGLVRKDLWHIVEGARANNPNLRIWRIGAGAFVEAEITPELVLKPDQPLKPERPHGVIAPAKIMTVADYEQALADTRPSWVIDETGE
jgi:hypothetical protein